MKSASLVRSVRLPGAIMMGLGSILGTGVFVSLGLAAGLTGAAMVGGLLLAALLAICNGLSTAQLAANHPLSGGTYEYGYQYLKPWLGFLAGWLFVIAKSASAATAAIGFGGYFLNLWNTPNLDPWHLGLLATALIVLLSLAGIRRTSHANIAIVTVTLTALLLYIFGVGRTLDGTQLAILSDVAGGFRLDGFLEATALLFVAYTGYGRIATLGEEIEAPRRNIPKAIGLTLAIALILYLAVAWVSIGAVGADEYFALTVETNSPLEGIAARTGQPALAILLSLGAIAAMLGVLLNLVLGISRVIFAMARREDLPSRFARVTERGRIPLWATLATGIVIGFLVLMKDVKTTWSFSAFTVLFYYSITNAAALRLPPERRLYPRFFAWIGLFGCLGLSFWVNTEALLICLGLMGLGLIWRRVYQGRAR